MAPADAARNKEEVQKQGIDTTDDWSRAVKEEEGTVVTYLVTNLLSFKVSGRLVFVLCVPEAHLWTTNIVRDVTISGPVFIVGTDDIFLPSGWITVIGTPSNHNSQGASPGSSVPQISAPVLATAGEPVQTSISPIVTPSPVPNAVPQLGAEPTLSDPTGPCSINTAPPDQQQSSYEECQRTIAPGGICCIPGVPDPSDVPSKTTASTPASAPASPTSTPSSSSTSIPSSSSTVTSKSLTTPTTPPAPSTLPPTSTPPASSAPASEPSAPAPMPTAIVPPKHKTPILPVLIPCSLAAAGIVAFGIWCTVWRSRGPPHQPPPSVDMAPRVVNSQKVFEAGNFAGAEAFEKGIEEMGRKEKVSDEGSGRWKGGYRKYRESGTGSGLLGKRA
ncbi:hypothetical protein P171DRAFT_487482 [Karstenula rhodostoma CBS 690.94]|uniref:Uncharacterized protein n=1 Tax=Karstenula rhodostoma CBS 690.94 TaxID=1392251 RepID=A0A9P4PE22_9PLEO|nr:hypothetical protein P171DRAFT_487482 [Karstenula rhodostoma CBS 690.94]